MDYSDLLAVPHYSSAYIPYIFLGGRRGTIVLSSPWEAAQVSEEGVCGPLDAHLGRSRAALRLETEFPQLPAPLIRGMIDFLAASKDSDYGISEEHKALPVTVSGTQIDRWLLAPEQKALELREISVTHAAGASPRFQAPVQTRFDRKAMKPGEESV